MTQQQPNNTQVPQHRQQDVMEQNRILREQVRQLQDTINQVAQRQMQPVQQPVQEDFEAPVAAAIEKKVKSLLTPEVTQLKQNMGYLVDENDSLRFIQKYGHETYEKYKSQIEQERTEANRMGRFATREEAYRKIFFDEHQRKPQATPEAPKQPVYDPYTGQWQQPPQQTQTIAPEAPVVQPPVQTPVAPVAQPQQPVVAQPPQEPSFQLPPAGPQNPAVQASPTGRVPQTISLESTDADLAAWAQKYGDVEL